VFTPPDERETPTLLAELADRYGAAKREARTHPLVLIGALIVDLLAIHPVADGNGRLARLVTTYELLAAGYGVARYVSVEQRIFEAKNAYYQSLYESQRGWHEGQHTIWPWATFLVRILGGAYDDFEQRVAAGSNSMGSKQDRVREHILGHAPAEFRTRDIHRALPGISSATVRLVLNELRDAGRISSHGTGAGARWHRNASLDNDLGSQADHDVIAGARLASARTGLAFMWPGPARTPTLPHGGSRSRR
jgi:Fic family protein